MSAARTAGREVASGMLALLVLAAFAAPAGAQPIYRFVSAAGNLVFSDRVPSATRLAGPSTGSRESEQLAVRLLEVTSDSGQAALLAINELGVWAQVAYRIEASRNLDPLVPRAGNFLLPPLSETRLLALAPIDQGSKPELDISFQYLLGHPGTRHRPDGPYRLPYSLDAAYRVSQAYPELYTHTSIANRHAIDFEMPVGTRVAAARAGLVVETASEFLDGGLDDDDLRDRANFVRILHDDGTLALYGHLQRRSIRVVPGQRVARGEHIADSGNSGFSSGPHLHFVVQRNRAGAIESVPVTFAGADGEALRPVTGDRPVAY